jgi:hypothetical protein
MPMFTTWRMRLPVCPVQAPLRTLSANTAIFARSAFTAAWNGALASMARSAVCKAARPSVGLTTSPANIASRRASTPASRASCTSRPSVSSVMRFFEKSAARPPPVNVKRSARVGAVSFCGANQSRSWASRICP